VLRTARAARTTPDSTAYKQKAKGAGPLDTCGEHGLELWGVIYYKYHHIGRCRVRYSGAGVIAPLCHWPMPALALNCIICARVRTGLNWRNSACSTQRLSHVRAPLHKPHATLLRSSLFNRRGQGPKARQKQLGQRKAESDPLCLAQLRLSNFRPLSPSVLYRYFFFTVYRTCVSQNNVGSYGFIITIMHCRRCRC
jgi:hypothetical protein